MNIPKKPKRSRRTFIKSSGLFIAGASLLKPSFLRAGNSKMSALAAGELPGDVLPRGVKAVWDLSRAHRESTPSRERVSINGLWKWQPGMRQDDEVQGENWGYAKVPANWPGIKNYMQKETQRFYTHPQWSGISLDDIDVAWYHRAITIPGEWAGRRIILEAEYLNSHARVFIDDKKAGEMIFPAGKLDITQFCRPGSRHVLAMKVTALPLRDVVAVYSDSNAPGKGRGRVINRGLCGDTWLYAEPSGCAVENVKVNTSVRQSKIDVQVTTGNLEPGVPYTIRAVITDNGHQIKSFTSHPFSADELTGGIITLSEPWLPNKLWDIHTPENMYELTVSLLDNKEKPLDTSFPVRFGFRELWIDGRDFYLNGSRIYMSAIPLNNAQIGAALASYEGARETMLRMKSYGINLVYSHNYGCEPGAHLGFEEILRAADDVGMLFSLSQPHFGQYDWSGPDADRDNGYARHAAFYTKVAGNHPSVVFYATSHNATGYNEDMNPDKIDGLSRPSRSGNVKKALRAEAIIHSLDPGRIVYHHSSGNLSSMHTSNFYPNWVPMQELSDWFGHWATTGVKPLFLVEYGAPFPWDWSLYRGWYKGKRTFGDAVAPWEFCLAEWNAQFMGENAYNISEYEKKNLRWEAERFREGATWHRWDYPYSLGSDRLEERNPVYAMHTREHWRAFRTWGLSVNSPWDHSSWWILKDGGSNDVKHYETAWEDLQKPGFSPDFIARAGNMDADVGFDRSDWQPTVAAKALTRNNMSLLAYIGGKAGAFTTKDHNFLPGESCEKQLIIINNTRGIINCDCRWNLDVPGSVPGHTTVKIKTGHQERLPVKFNLPPDLKPGSYLVEATFNFSNGETQEDTFKINVLPKIQSNPSYGGIALFDPKGETRTLLDNIGAGYQVVDAGTDLSGYEMLIIGKEALGVDRPGPDVSAVRDGLKVIMFEQSAAVLEKRFGFRIQEYGLRQVYKRIADHPVLDGLDNNHLADWRGSSTLLSPRLDYESDNHVFNGAPTVRWCDIPVTRIWRCGNRGNVASVLIEKPACGDFLPLLDGGFSMQYSPLLEYHEGQGMVMFCQLDVTGRSEQDPAANRVVSSLLNYVSDWEAGVKRGVVYAGEPAGKAHLESSGIPVSSPVNGKISPEQVLVIGPGGGDKLASKRRNVKKWLKKGGRLVVAGLDQAEANAILPTPVKMKKEEHIAAYFEPGHMKSFYTGIGPADVHNRAPKEISRLSGGAEMIGDGIIAKTGNQDVVFCQLVPWQLDYGNGQHNVKQTFRRWSFTLNRIIANMGVEMRTPVLERFRKGAGEKDRRWLTGLYLDEPEEWDDPYRFFRW